MSLSSSSSSSSSSFRARFFPAVAGARIGVFFTLVDRRRAALKGVRDTDDDRRDDDAALTAGRDVDEDDDERGVEAGGRG